MFNLQAVKQAVFLVIIFMATIVVYQPGLEGGFLFDDSPNLAYLGHDGGVVDRETLNNFVFSGVAGPTGRPVALASFLLDDNTWPSQGRYFKLTNLLIHVLSGLVLCWATLLLLRLFGVDEQRAVWVAVLNMGIWLLHPYFVSTTLYVVQRMAQLAALFMFAGLAGYFHGRMLLNKRPWSAYLWMSLALVFGTGLATLSKENGILLPLLICIVEFCLPPKTRAFYLIPDWRWRAVFLWLPSVAVLLYLANRINFSPDLWPARPFNQVERLLSESRILWEYLYYLWVPHIEGRGLFQDGYTISRGWLEPPLTIVAVLGLVVLVAMAILLRRKWPLVSLAILFFFGAHLIESSVIGLELYFEHRSYVAAAFMFLPLAFGLVALQRYLRPSLVVVVVGLLLCLLAGLTWQRSALWSDTDALQTYWAVNNPQSARAQHRLAVQLFERGHWGEGMALLEAAEQRLPESALLTMQWLSQRVVIGVATRQDFERVEQRLAKQSFDAQALLGLRHLAEYLAKDGNSQYRQWMLETVAGLDSNERYQRIALYRRLSPYVKGTLLLAEAEPVQAMEQFSVAMRRYADTDTALAIVAQVGMAGHPEQAMVLLDQAETVFANQPVRSLKRSSEVYRYEMDRLRGVLQEDIYSLTDAEQTPLEGTQE